MARAPFAHDQERNRVQALEGFRDFAAIFPAADECKSIAFGIPMNAERLDMCRASSHHGVEL